MEAFKKAMKSGAAIEKWVVKLMNEFEKKRQSVCN
jgi:hypothetical protein